MKHTPFLYCSVKLYLTSQGGVVLITALSNHCYVVMSQCIRGLKILYIRGIMALCTHVRVVADNCCKYFILCIKLYWVWH